MTRPNDPRSSGGGDVSSSADRVIDEAKRHFVPPTHGSEHDWSAADARLFARLRSRQSTIGTERLSTRGTKLAVTSGIVLAMAAAVTLFMRPSGAPVRLEAPTEIAASVELGDSVRVIAADGTAARGRSALRVGDRIETAENAVGFLSRFVSGERAVAWRVEGQSQLMVERAHAPLGLALETGAVEADVTRVPQGEAFVVDIGTMRVAVKGTHLRVARAGNAATVDLSEGTIAFGPVPAANADPNASPPLTEGTRVTAPAHVEIDLLHPEALRIERGTEFVRAREFDHDVRTPAVIIASARPASSEAALELEPALLASAKAAPRVVPRPSAVKIAPLPTPDVRPPSQIVADAIHACIEKHVPHGPARVTIDSALLLEMDDAGAVKLARFEPPLSPEVQTCAASTIYKTRFAGQTSERIQINAER